MDSKKFDKLIELIINENEQQARELFHDIVVEKSREIYESMMDDEMMEMDDMGMEEGRSNFDHDAFASMIQSYKPKSYAGELVHSEFVDMQNIPHTASKIRGLIDLIMMDNLENGQSEPMAPGEKQDMSFFLNAVKKASTQSSLAEDDSMVGEVGDLMDEINSEESGMNEEEEDFEDEEEIVDIDSEDMEEPGDLEEIEDAVIRIEDKLDQLMAEFEEVMGSDMDDEDMGDEEGAEDMGDEEGEEEEMSDEEVMEAIALKKVSVTHGDNGANSKSISLHEPKVKVAGVNPVKFSGAHETVPTSPKGPSNAYSKGEGQVPHAGKWKNAPAQAGQDLEKAPKAHTGQASGVNTKSPVNEGRKVAKKRV
jgi:hypothetical protein